MKVRKTAAVLTIICVFASTNVYATGGSKQPERPVTESSVSWYQSVMDYFGF